MEAHEIEASLQAFRLSLLVEHPFYGDILLRLPIIRDDSVPTACTDGRTIRWSARFFRDMTPKQIRYVLMHEVFHTLLVHPLRSKDRNHEIWNVAADIIVNQMCDALAYELRNSLELALERPDNGIFRQVSLDETVENLYGRILADNRNGTSGGSLLLRENYRPGAGGETQRVSLPEADLRGVRKGALRLSDEEREALEQQITDLIRNAGSHLAGASPSMLTQRLLRIVPSKKLDWRKLLKDFLTETQSDDTSYTTPERKYLHMDLILPGHGTQEGGELDSVWAFVDSSGSIDDATLNEFLTQLYRITKDFGCVMNIAYWDTSVTDVYTKLRSAKQVMAAQPNHSGGTDINCVYRYIRERRLKPLVTLILTDGYFGVPDPALKKCLDPRATILLLSNNSVNPVYKTVGRVCRLSDA